jgi:tryptophan-rich sensory protein
MISNDKLSSSWKLVIAALICVVTGVASGFFSQASSSTWFSTLNKPLWNPPSYLFAPVWIALYLLMGVALWLV